MEGVSEASTDTIEKYLDDSPIKFHLFAYLNEIIFDRLELKEHKREIFCRENEEYLLIDRGKIKSTFVRIGKQEAERN